MSENESTGQEKPTEIEASAVDAVVSAPRWFAQDGTVYMEGYERLAIVILDTESKSYMNLPNHIAERLAAMMNGEH